MNRLNPQQAQAATFTRWALNGATGFSFLSGMAVSVEKIANFSGMWSWGTWASRLGSYGLFGSALAQRITVMYMVATGADREPGLIQKAFQAMGTTAIPAVCSMVLCWNDPTSSVFSFMAGYLMYEGRDALFDHYLARRQA
ncbi:MAG: hypothetical protein JSS32_05990 [Verrucomicrobia bacterium]|nr:hypothetical protein [Verrucomicrobiota bacterium]